MSKVKELVSALKIQDANVTVEYLAEDQGLAVVYVPEDKLADATAIVEEAECDELHAISLGEHVSGFVLSDVEIDEVIPNEFAEAEVEPEDEEEDEDEEEEATESLIDAILATSTTKDLREVFEKKVKKVVDGKVIIKDVPVRKKKKRMSSKQKAALKKARAKANTGAAKRARAKSMKKRQSAGL